MTTDTWELPAVHRRNPDDVERWASQPPRWARLRAMGRRISANPSRQTSLVLGATYPRAVSSLGRHGVLIGTDVATGNAFAYDPFELYRAAGIDRLQNPNGIVAGGIGQGKTNLVLSYLTRQVPFGRKERVFSVKPGEYDRFAELVGASTIRVSTAGTTVLNPLDAAATGDTSEVRALRLTVLIALMETRLGRELRTEESSALGLALDVAAATSDRPDLPRVLACLRDPEHSMLAELRMDGADWTARLFDLTTGLYDLCRGQYGGLFGSQTSAGMDLDADVVVFDLEPLSRAGALALPMFMAVASAHLHNTLARETSRNLILVFEEGWQVLAHPGVIRWMQRAWKLARSYGVQNLIVLHRPSDFAAAGAAGSLARELATGLLADTATKVVYAPEAHEREATARLLGLTPDERDALADLQVGEALWRIGDRSTRVRHERSLLERELFSTDAGMLRGVA
jgi:hypothetical protein